MTEIVPPTGFHRAPPLAGGRNFRDLGGYPTTGGRRLRWGVLYRSGLMSGLTAEDVAYLSGLGVKVVCDLRTPDERKTEPSVPGFAERLREWDYDIGHRSLYDAALREAATPEDVRNALIAAYREMPWLYAELYRGVLEHLIAGDLPLVFHCTGGKDRTGLLAGLLLLALSVPEEIVFQDYVLTDQLLDTEKLLAGLKKGQGAGGFAFMGAMSAELRAPLMICAPAYLKAALTAVEQRCGSVLAYFEQVLGVGADGVEVLRDRLLEAA
jgi:protein-tyrosine phosphatase